MLYALPRLFVPYHLNNIWRRRGLTQTGSTGHKIKRPLSQNSNLLEGTADHSSHVGQTARRQVYNPNTLHSLLKFNKNTADETVLASLLFFYIDSTTTEELNTSCPVDGGPRPVFISRRVVTVYI